MKKLIAALFVCTLGTLFAPAAAFADHVHVFVGGGYGYGGYGGCCYYPPAYYGYPAYYYAAPPPVVYVPQQQPTVVYASPPATTTYAPTPAPAPVPAPNTVAADPSSPTYTDSQGRTCREYQTQATVDGAPQQMTGTACLQPDGTWRIVH